MSILRDKKRLILLQGPVGPTFMRIAEHFESIGWDVTQVVFNAGDALFSHKRHRMRFTGSIDNWRKTFGKLIDLRQETSVCYFGCERPAHKIAAEICQSRGVEAWSFEEGYIRPGFVTVERYGNNASSPLAGQLPDTSLDYPEINKIDYRGAKWMWWYAFLYYNARWLFSKRSDKTLYHRHVNLVMSAFTFIRNGWRMKREMRHEMTQVKQLQDHFSGRYFVAPLQVETDMHMNSSHLGCNSSCFVDRVTQSFAEEAPAGTQLIFKIHPLDRGNNARFNLVREAAIRYGIEDRVKTVCVIGLSELLSHAAGLITINSTSALVAFEQQVPVALTGQAVYQSDQLVTQIASRDDLDAFWKVKEIKSAGLTNRYLRFLVSEALIKGDLYNPEGQQALILGLAQKISAAELVQPAPILEVAHG